MTTIGKIKYAPIKIDCPTYGVIEGHETDKGVRAKDLEPGHLISWATNDSDHEMKEGIHEIVKVTHDPGHVSSTGRVLRSPEIVLTIRRNGKNRIITSMPDMWKRTYKK